MDRCVCRELLLPGEVPEFDFSMVMHYDICVYTHDRSCSHSHDFVLGFLKEKDVNETEARALYPEVTVYFVSKCFHIVTGYPILDCPVVLSLELMGITINQVEQIIYSIQVGYAKSLKM